MDRKSGVQEIKASWRRLYPASRDGKGIVCPFCGHGTSGDGIVEDPKAKNPHSLICFNCHFYGSVIDMIMQEHHLDFNEATDYAAAELGITIDQARTSASEDFKEAPKAAGAEMRRETSAKDETPAAAGKSLEKAQDAPKKADYVSYYRECAARINEPAAASYLEARGISQETAARFMLGWDPKADPANAPGATGSEYRPHPTPRLIVPITKSYYIGRRTDGGDQYKKLNSKGSGVGIFNENALQEKPVRPIFIVEGFMDALSIIEAGAQAVAINSTSNVKYLMQALSRHQAKAPLILCSDNDKAGRKCNERLKSALDAAYIPYFEAEICGDDQKDANEALVADRGGFIERINYILADREIVEATAAANKTKMDLFLDRVRSETYKPYQTGLKFLDELLDGGFCRQTLVMFMAAPGAGKTSFCVQMAEEIAAAGKPIVYINFEMSADQMLAKALSYRLMKKDKRYTATQILRGYKWSDDQAKDITEAAREYQREIVPFLEYNPDGVSTDLDNIIEYLSARGEAAKDRNEEAPAVIIDYLHLITTTQRLDIQELIKQAVVRLKQYAIKYNTFVIAISATNRNSNSKGKITLNSGRDSSNIEYTGDSCLALNYTDLETGTVKPEDEDALARIEKEQPRRMTLKVLKGRFYEVGNRKGLYFMSAYNFFYEVGEFGPAPDDEEMGEIFAVPEAPQKKKRGRPKKASS